jgi:amino acid adenylation domain-containing protein
MRASMTYRESRISADLANQLADYFAHFIAAILQSPHGTVKELVGLTSRDQHRLLQWNGPISPPPAECIHELIAQQAANQPSNLAVSSWDGNWTYEELDRAAVRLAASLVAHGVKPSQYVPICSEKSPWAIVAVLAVMKAGATFVPLDPSHPFPRLRALCESVHATHVVSSATQASLCLKLAEKIIIIAGETSGQTTSDLLFQSVVVDPEQPAYILFTSGTTGTPKGVMVPHSSYTAAAREQIRAFSLDPGSRVLQFSSYAFDVAVLEILTTLLAGGTVCVPSDVDRDQMLLDGACPFAVTHAFLTPSVATTLDASQPGWVKTMILLGEPMSIAHITQWGEKCHLMNAYGPTECSVLNTSRAHIVPGCDPGNMGQGLGIHFWVADQHDHGKLVPVGAVGELILGGPPVAQGYINDARRTAEAFIQHPQWLKALMPRPYPWRLYKTGDLVRYEVSDGSLRYEGRKDRQIKIRGQRVELEEIEYHTHRCFPHASNAVVEHVMLPSGQDSASAGNSAALVPRLVACICHEAARGSSVEKASQMSERDSADELLAPSTPGFRADAVVALTRLRDAMPGYMVPNFFLPIRRVPRQKSGKTDRPLLREAISAGQAEFRWLNRTMPLGEKQYPRTEVESKLHAILSRHLSLAPETVGIDENLFYLGGDSIVAMKIAASARESGLNISLYDILRRPTVLGWADAVLTNRSAVTVVEPRSAFCLISDDEYREVVRLLAAAEPPITEANLEDILPALESQAHYVESSSIVNFAEVFPTDLDPDRLRSACQQLVSRYSILRTVFWKASGRLLQVILRHFEPQFSLLQCDDAESYLTQQTTHRTTPATPLGSPLTSFGLIKSTTRKTSALVVRLSHAQYDGASLPFLWQAIKAAYQGDPLSDLTPFSHLVHHRKGRDHADTASFWRTYLQGASAAALDPLQIANFITPPENPNLLRTARRELMPPSSVSGATVATIVKAALSWILSRYSSRSDIILGQVAHGRGSAIPNVHQILGPCVTFLPIRIALNLEHTVAQFLQYVQLQQVLTVPHDSLSLEEITRHCTDWPSDARFGCLVHHQAAQSQDPFEMDGIPSCSSVTWATSRPPPGQINVISIERETTLDLVLAAPPNALDQVLLDRLADRLADTIRLFSNVPACSLAALEQYGVECPSETVGSSLHLNQTSHYPSTR